MKKYRTIKELVIEETKKLGKYPNENYLTKLVLEQFPNSKWQKTHYSWYKSKIKNNHFDISTSDLDKEEKTNDVSLSLEKDLQSYISTNLDQIETGLELFDDGIEYKTKAGFIDILATDKNNNLVVIELKAGVAKDSSIGQILGYIGALKQEKNTDNIRGIIVASDFDKRLNYATKTIENLSLIKYSINFSFDKQ